jgi:Iron-dependent Transcriptional regulator
VIAITFPCCIGHRPVLSQFRTIQSERIIAEGKDPSKEKTMSWPSFPKRLQSALKALCCLARRGTEMQSPAIAEEIVVPKAETSKILQLLVWGGFVTSRRGTKGGFQLASAPERITMGEVMDFFLARHPEEADPRSPVARAMQLTLASGQKKYAGLTLARVASLPPNRPSKLQPASPAGKIVKPLVRKLKVSQAHRRSRSNVTNR